MATRKARQCRQNKGVRRAHGLRFGVPADSVDITLSSLSSALILHLDTRPDNLSPCQDAIQRDDEYLRIRTVEVHVRRRTHSLTRSGGMQVHLVQPAGGTASG